MTQKPLFIRLNLPTGLEESLEGLAKEVLRSQPSNILHFSAEYFENQGLPANQDIFDYIALSSDVNPNKYDNAPPLEDGTEVENLSGDDIDLNDPDVAVAATKIQAGYRGSKARRDMKSRRDDESKQSIKIQMPVQTMDDEDEGLELDDPEAEEAELDIDLEDPEVANAATKIQAGYRGMKTRKHLRPASPIEIDLADPEVEKAATKIQAGFKGMRTRKQMRKAEPVPEELADIDLDDPEMNQAATKIQAGYRGMQTRRGMKVHDKQPEDEVDIDLDDPEVQEAATKIQAGFRGMKARKQAKPEAKDEEDSQENIPSIDIDLDDPEVEKAATKIQAGYKGMRVRREMRGPALALPSNSMDADDSSQELAATKIQAGYRGMRVRKGLKATQAENEEGIDIDLDDPEVERAATKIQAGYKGMRARKELRQHQEEPNDSEPMDIDLEDPEVERAATKIQAGYKGMRARKQLKRDNEEEPANEVIDIDLTDPEIEQAATKIQAGYKGMRARRALRQHQEEINADEAIDIDLEDPDMERAATKIQAGYKGMRARKELRQNKEELKDTEAIDIDLEDPEVERAATKIQAGYKGMRSRKSMREKAAEHQDEIDIDLEDPEVLMAASRIQAGYKGMRTRKSMREKAAEAEQGDIDIDLNDPEVEKAATRIQAGYRGMRTRQGMKPVEAEPVPEDDTFDIDLEDPEVERAATKIQAGYKGMRARRGLRTSASIKAEDEIDIDMEDPDEERAATKIQAGYRGMRTRREMQGRNEIVEPAEDPIDIDLTDPEVDRAATKIQAGYKGMRERKKLRENQALEIDLDDPDLAQAATKIQAGYRGHQARKDYVSRREVVSNRKNIPKSLDEFNRNIEDDIVDIDLSDPDVEKAATKIQAGYKGMKTRKTLRALPEEFPEESPETGLTEDQAATKIQAGYRGMRARKEIVPLNLSEMTRDGDPFPEEGEPEAIDIDLSDPEVERAATKIQAGYKGMRTRKSMREKAEEQPDAMDIDLTDPEVERAATKIQAGYKGMRTRRELKIPYPEEAIHMADPEMEQAATKIQAGYRGMRTRRGMKPIPDVEVVVGEEITPRSESEGDLSKMDPQNELVEGELDHAASAAEVDAYGEPINIDMTAPDMEQAATKIQAGFRGMQARKGIQGRVAKAEDAFDIDLNDPEVEAAASKIQAGYMGMRTRRDLAARRPDIETVESNEEVIIGSYPEDDETISAATKIQAGFKGMKARRDLSQLRQNRDLMDRDEDSQTVISDIQETLIVATHVDALGAIPFDMHPSAVDGPEDDEDEDKDKKGKNRQSSAGSEREDETFIAVGEESPSKVMRQDSVMRSSSLDASSSSLKPKNDLPPIMLYHYSRSYNSQKVVIYLRERGIQYSGYHVDLQRNEHLSNWFLDLNPKGEVPVMKFDNQVIVDSSRIIHHLEAHVPGETYPLLVPLSSETLLYQQYLYFAALLDNIPLNQVVQGVAFHPELSLAQGRSEPYDEPQVFEKIQQTAIRRGLVLRQTAESNEKAASDLRKRASQFEKEILPNVKDRSAFEDTLDQVESILEKVEAQLSTTMHLEDECQGWLLGSSFSALDITLGVSLNRLAQLGLQPRFWLGDPARPHLLQFLEEIQKRPHFQCNELGLGQARVDLSPLDSALEVCEAGNGNPATLMRTQLTEGNSDSVDVWQELKNGIPDENVSQVDDEEPEEEVTWKSLW
eukprot:snap_masked-scaffold101_size371023-processed-gene-0.7 protein:Tk03051 transcript:snap_masked-scaffold101_size371023-processed-gene-0.7-mRNA-1 annotation:"sperm surface protein sp17"